MKLNKKLATLSLAATMLLTFSACGGSDDAAPEEVKESTTPTESKSFFTGSVVDTGISGLRYVCDSGKLYFDEAMEKKAAIVMSHNKFTISCDLGVADGAFKAYGCDLGYEYVKINADYRT